MFTHPLHTRHHTKRRFMKLSAALTALREDKTWPPTVATTQRYGRLVTLYTEARRRWRAARGWA